MRPYPKWSRYPLTKEGKQWTPRMLKAAERAVQRQKEDIPLFPDMVRDKTVEARVERIDKYVDHITRTMRAFNAKKWREARALLRTFDSSQRLMFVRAWNASHCPATGSYLLSFHRLRQSRLQDRKTMTPKLYTADEANPQEIAPANGTDFQLAELQALVGGYVEVLNLGDGTILCLNEDGRSKGLPHNRFATFQAGLAGYGDIVGPAVHCLSEAVQ